MLREPWHIQLLGGLTASQQGARIERFRSRKASTLLAYLALHNQAPVPRERLADILWPEEDVEVARNRLRVTLTSLRRQLEPPPALAGSVIVADRSNVSLREGLVVTDVNQFRHSIARASRAPEDRARVDALIDAVGLYRGELMPGYYEDWIDEERRALEQLFHHAAGETVDLLCDLGRSDEAFPIALRAAAIDNLDEEAQRRLMSVYWHLGQPGRALELFEALQRRLQEELGAEPSGDTLNLAERIRREPPPCSHRDRTPQRRAEPEQLAVPSAGEPRHSVSLPAASSSFHGREDELARLRSILAPPQIKADGGVSSRRLITLTGLGGIGKTRLGLQAARQCSELFAGGTWFVPLADVEDSRQIDQAIADAMHLRLLPNLLPIEQIVEELNARTSAGGALLLLDNFEQLVGAGTSVVELLLAGAPQLTLLVTSRRLLGITGEREFRVEPLSLPPDHAGAEQAVGSASVALFVARAQAALPDFQVTPRNAASVAELCQALEGIPLAIELAAARIRLLTPAQMIAEMNQRFDLLVNRRAGKDARHRSLLAAVERSVQMLPGAVRDLCCLLSVFRGSWNLAAAREVSADHNVLDMLDDLAGYSLIKTRASDGEMRYSMLETIREYAAAQLPEDLRAVLHGRHAAHYAAWTGICEREALGPARQSICAVYEEEKENIRAAWQWALQFDPGLAMEIAANLRWIFFLQHRLREGEAMMLRALQANDGTYGQPAVKAMLSLGIVRCYMDDFAGAGEALRAAIDGLEESQMRERRLADSFLGWVTMHEGDYGRALTLLEEARRQFARHGETWSEAGCLNLAGFAACYSNNLAHARELFASSRELYIALGDHRLAAHCPLGLARVAWKEGDLVRAERGYREALAEFQQHGDRRGIAYALEGIARVASSAGEHLEAVRFSGAAQVVRDRIALRRDPMDMSTHEAVMRAAIDALAEPERERAWQAGMLMGAEAAETYLPDGG